MTIKSCLYRCRNVVCLAPHCWLESHARGKQVKTNPGRHRLGPARPGDATRLAQLDRRLVHVDDRLLRLLDASAVSGETPP